VRDFADRVIVMKDGQIVETGLIKDIFANPKQTYTQNLLSASLEADPDLQAKRREQRKKLQQLKQ
jgi:peptide/nickel transport system ATP-binding protein